MCLCFIFCRQIGEGRLCSFFDCHAMETSFDPSGSVYQTPAQTLIKCNVFRWRVLHTRCMHRLVDISTTPSARAGWRYRMKRYQLADSTSDGDTVPVLVLPAG